MHVDPLGGLSGFAGLGQTLQIVPDDLKQSENALKCYWHAVGTLLCLATS